MTPLKMINRSCKFLYTILIRLHVGHERVDSSRNNFDKILIQHGVVVCYILVTFQRVYDARTGITEAEPMDAVCEVVISLTHKGADVDMTTR